MTWMSPSMTVRNIAWGLITYSHRVTVAFCQPTGRIVVTVQEWSAELGIYHGNSTSPEFGTSVEDKRCTRT